MQELEQSGPEPYQAMGQGQLEIQMLVVENVREGSTDADNTGSIELASISETLRTQPCT